MLDAAVICCSAVSALLCLCHGQPSVPEAFYFYVCPFIDDSVSESVHPENVVDTISEKPVK